MSRMRIKVSTEALRRASVETNQEIDRVQNLFNNLEEVIKSSSLYWEGEGQQAYSHSFIEKKQYIDTALKRFRENVTDLREMAGIYHEAEQQAKEHAQMLSSDIII